MRPSTSTRAASSTLVPSSRTIRPPTRTRPATISSSARRRDDTPAAARYFCSRSAGILDLLEVERGHELVVGFGPRQRGVDPLRGLDARDAGERAPQVGHLVERDLAEQLLLVPVSAAHQVDRRVSPHLGELARQDELGVRHRRELVKQERIERGGAGAERCEHRQRTAALDGARGAEQALRALQRRRVDLRRASFVMRDRGVRADEPGQRGDEDDRVLAELGQDAVVLVSSLTRLVRAYAAISHHKGSAAQIDAATLQRPKRLFGAARAVEGGGSLTVLATLSAGASAFDALLLDEFSPVANAELILARELAEVRAYPPVDLMRSGNWYEEQLLSEIALHKVTDLRRALSGVASVEASERIYAALARTKSNDEFVTALDLKKV